MDFCKLNPSYATDLNIGGHWLCLWEKERLLYPMEIVDVVGCRYVAE
jgi:hypothetical protein